MVVGGFGDSSIRIYDVEAMADHRMRDAEGRLEAAGCSRTGGEADTACEVDDMDWEGDLGALRGQDGMDNLFAQGSVRRLSKKSLDSLQRRMPQDRDELTVLWGHAGPVYSVSWSANERYLLSSSSDCTIRLWSMDLGSNLVAYHGHSHPIWSVQASPQVWLFHPGH